MLDKDDHSEGESTWRLASGALLVAVLILGFITYSQYRRAEQVTALLLASEQQSAALRTELHKTTRQVSELQAAATATAETLKEVAKPDLPISIGFRKAFFGGGITAVFRNNSGAPLEVSAVFTSPSTGQKREGNLVIPPEGVQEFGQKDGWAFAPGQHIDLSNNNFRPGSIVVPSR